MTLKNDLTGTLRTGKMVCAVLCCTLTGCTSWFGSKKSRDIIFSSYDTRHALQVSREYGSINEAVSELKRKLKNKPNDIKNRLILSRLYLIKGRKKLSEIQARQVEKYQFKNIKAKIILANIYYLKGFNDQTRLVLDPLLRHPKLTKGERNEVLNLLAGVSLREGQDSQSISYLKWSLKTNPAHLASHVNLGLIYLKNQEYKLAASHFKAVLAAKSDNFAAKLNLAICLASQKRYEKAEEMYDELYSADPENHQLIYNLAVLKYRKRAYQESIELLRDYVDLAPSKFIAKRNAMKIINEIQLSRVRVKGLSNDDIQDLTERLQDEDAGSQPLSFDASSELDAGFVFTNVGFIPD